VGQFVRQQPAPSIGAGRTLALAENDVSTDSIGERAD
jgi:hypothetical protein